MVEVLMAPAGAPSLDARQHRPSWSVKPGPVLDLDLSGSAVTVPAHDVDRPTKVLTAAPVVVPCPVVPEAPAANAGTAVEAMLPPASRPCPCAAHPQICEPEYMALQPQTVSRSGIARISW